MRERERAVVEVEVEKIKTMKKRVNKKKNDKEKIIQDSWLEIPGETKKKTKRKETKT